MKKAFIGLTLVSALLLSGCMVLPLSGALYTDVRFHTGDHQQDPGPKTGESCVTNILGLIATGDASAVGAAKAAGIKKVNSIDYRMTNILGLYGTYCIIVTGE